MYNNKPNFYEPLNTRNTTFNIQLGMKEMDLSFVLYPFITEVGAKGHKVHPVRAYLYLRKSLPYEEYQSMSEGDRKFSYISIHEWNLPQYKKLFREGDDILLELANSIYVDKYSNKLCYSDKAIGLERTCVNDAKYNQATLRLVTIPNYDKSNDKPQPALGVQINSTENYSMLLDYEYRNLSRFIQEFNFIQFTQYVMMLHQYSIINGNLITQETIKKRRDNHFIKMQ